MYFRFATPPTPTSCTANTVFDIISRSPRSRCIIAYSDDLHQSDAHQQHAQTQNTRQFRRGWRSNFSPLTWCNTGPYSGKRRAARGAPQMLHTQEEEERQKCIIKEKKKPFEWRLQCSTVHYSNPFSVCGLFEIICIVFVALLYYHCRATLLWMKLGGGGNKDFAFYWLQVKNKNHNNNKNNRNGGC